SVDLPLSLVLGNTVSLLKSADQLVALSFDLIDIIVSQLAPFLTNLTLELLPVTFNPIPIHYSTPVVDCSNKKTRRPSQKFPSQQNLIRPRVARVLFSCN